jgi:hypothetical protein
MNGMIYYFYMVFAFDILIVPFRKWWLDVIKW